MNKLAVVLLLLISTDVAGHVKSDNPNDSAKSVKIDEFMNALFERGQFTGAILVAEQGRIIYEKAFGMADKSKGKRFEISTSEYIGSISKQFTAAGIAILNERGKLKYNQRIRTFFPELPASMNEVTIQNLIHHTSGLATFNDFPDMTEQDVFEILKKQETLHFNPGEQFEYCNAGYTLLGMIIERITGKSLNEFLTDNIFKPTHMESTSVNELVSRNTARAIGYDQFGTENNYDSFIGGAASIISTVEDLYKWDRALYNPKFMKPKSVKKALEASAISLKDDVYGQKSYGFGWWVSNYGGARNVFHDGAFGGYRAYIERFLGSQNCIIHISNLRHAVMTEIRMGIVNILEGKPYVLPRMSIAVALYKRIQQEGTDLGIQWYNSLKSSATSTQYVFNESELNTLGYYLMRNKMIEDAIKVFKLNTTEYPESSNVFDSLGEAYSNNGNKTLAIESYERSLLLNPKNSNAGDMIKNLTK